MGRWKDNNNTSFFGFNPKGSKRNYKKIAKYVIAGGFVVVALVVLSVFIPRAGLSIEILERGEGLNLVRSISIKINNNNPQTLNAIAVQFDENEKIHQFGNIGPFSSIFITPDQDELDFKKVTVTANNGELKTIKLR